MSRETVHIQIDQRTLTTEKRVTLMESMVSAGVLLRSDCGGRGRCGKCRVRVADVEPGGLSEPDGEERQALGADRLAAGWRLACRAHVLGEVSLNLPGESRLTLEVAQKGLPLLLSRQESPPAPRRASVAPGYGIAVDVGTTTIAIYLCDRENRAVVASTSLRNPQAIFGDDVISRISAVRRDPETLPRLQNMVVSAVDWAVSALCRRTQIDPHGIGAVVAVGNSTMVHLLLGEDPSSIGVFPYAPRFLEERTVLAGSIGLKFNPGACLRTLPLISGYLGADIVGGALAANLPGMRPGAILVDVGTNGEVMVVAGGGLAATSCATGPAFEGAAIRHGMQATSGAIDGVSFNRETRCLGYRVIQPDTGPPQPPAGICGSGIISTVAELLRAGVISTSGSFDPSCLSPCLRRGEHGSFEFEIVPGWASRDGRPISLTQGDVRAVQLAKGALRTGIDLLCREKMIDRPSSLLLAGAFGSYINKRDALQLGMFPNMKEEEIEVVGNAAGVGAILALCEEEYFDRSRDLARATQVFELGGHPDFQNMFIQSLTF
jgi:uncharacterized 2Fe-2S/4Fe-4S cluster protein (DUF4445 family)